MKNIHLILIIAILILIYLISMQWLGQGQNKPSAQLMPRQLPERTMPPVVTPEPVTPPEITPESKDKEVTSPETMTPPAVESEKIDEEQKEIPNPDLIEYKNTNYGYHFSIPKKMYYAGFGAQDGAAHTIAIQTEALPESFDDSFVRVLYYGKKILPELQNAHNNRYEDPNGKYILLLLEGAYSVKIESDNLQSPTVLAIVSTIGKD